MCISVAKMAWDLARRSSSEMDGSLIPPTKILSLLGLLGDCARSLTHNYTQTHEPPPPPPVPGLLGISETYDAGLFCFVRREREGAGGCERTPPSGTTPI
jgi:hypothetical protein